MRRRLIAAGAAVLLAVGLVAGWQGWRSGNSAAASNRALTDATRTSEVQEAVTKALTAVLSYDHADPAVTDRAAQTWLVGSARREYDTLYASLKKRAPAQKLVLTAQVQTVGVRELDETAGEALVFLDQSSQRAQDKESSVSAAQLVVTVVQRDGVWRISSLKPL